MFVKKWDDEYSNQSLSKTHDTGTIVEKNRYIDCNILNNKRKSINQMMYKLISDKMQDYKNTIYQYKSIFPRVLERLH